MPLLTLGFLLALLGQTGGENGPPEAPEIQRARQKLAQGDGDGCLKLLEAAAKSDSTLPPANLLLANLLLGGGNVAGARIAIERAAAERDDHPEIFAAAGRLAVAEGRLLDATLQFEKAVELAGSNRWPPAQRNSWLKAAHSGLATVAERRRDWRRAQASLLVLSNFDAQDVRTRWRLGYAMFMIGRRDEGMKLVREAAVVDPKLEPADLTYGNLLSQVGEQKPAERAFRAAVENHSSDPRPHIGYAGWLLQQGRAAEAKDVIAAALQIDSQNVAARVVAVMVGRYLQDYATAERILTDWLQKAPADQFANTQLAYVLAESADAEKRKRAVEIAAAQVARAPHSAEALTALGRAQHRSGDRAAAERSLRAAYATWQSTSDCAYFLAVVLKEAGAGDEAKRLVEKAVSAKGFYVSKPAALQLARQLDAAVPPAEKP